LSGFWKWIKHFFVKEAPEMEEHPDDPGTIAKARSRLEELLGDEAFRSVLEQKISMLMNKEGRTYNINHYSHGDIVGRDKNVTTTNYYGTLPPQS
jgi:hypothetical protein